MVRCEICFNAVENYELHLEEKPRICRDRLYDRWIGKYNEKLERFIMKGGESKFYFTGQPVGCRSIKLKTPYYLLDPNNGMIESIFHELDCIFEDKKSQGLNPTGFGIFQLIPMGFIDWQEENPKGKVGLGIRYKIDYE